jgi:hypothetical protein
LLRLAWFYRPKYSVRLIEAHKRGYEREFGRPSGGYLLSLR